MPCYYYIQMNKKIAADEQKLSWTMDPTPGHFVHFYQDNNSLLEPLSDYISAGLNKGETCILIATERHVANINKRLEKAGLDVNTEQKNGKYIVLDAATTLSKFMIDGMPNEKLFDDVIRAVIDRAALAGKPIRAYGEMVALLWQEGNKDGVLNLEKLWNELAVKQSFSLFCAYPELHFIMHQDAIEEISNYHDINRAFATSSVTVV